MKNKVRMSTREWAIKNQRWSKKTNEGYWAPDGKFVPCPSCIVRFKTNPKIAENGWRINIHKNGKIKTYQVFDWDYSDPSQPDYLTSLEVAIDWFRELLEEEDILRARRQYINLSEPAKHGSNDIRGLSVCRDNTRNTLIICISVGGKKTSVYGGRDMNSGLFKERYEQAEKILQKFRLQQQEERRFD